MFTIFEKILIGHLIGDYLFQPKKMAILKATKGLTGLGWCVAHCILYTFIICLCTSTTDFLKVALIFLSHFPIDRWSLAKGWLKIIKGRDVMKAYESKEKFHEVDLVFSGLVYVIVDNTLHMILMMVIFRYC